ncbi:hypothetical protein MKX01_012323 [Papaver californicum]|nr:hypothetical protein MKX01_012323 [Papaver californicum]
MATGIARHVAPEQSPSATMGRRNVCGLTRGIEVSRTIPMNNGNKHHVVFSEVAPTCFNAPSPLRDESWTKIPEHHRSALIERIQLCFQICCRTSSFVDTTVPSIRKYLNGNMTKKFTNHRNKLFKHFKSFGTIENARLNPPSHVPQDSWNYLCRWFSTENLLAGSNNRAKVPYNHCGGSLPFVVHRELAQEVQLVYIQTFYDTHTHMVKNPDSEGKVQWISKEAQQDMYEKIVELYQQGIVEGSQPPEELAIFNEVTGAKRSKRHHPLLNSSSDESVNEFRDLIEKLNEKIQSQDDLILKYQDEIKEMKDENQKMKNDNTAFKQDMLNRMGFNPTMFSNLPIPPQEDN